MTFIKLDSFIENSELYIDPSDISMIETYTPSQSSLIQLNNVPPHCVVVMKNGKTFKVKNTYDEIVERIKETTKHPELLVENV